MAEIAGLKLIVPSSVTNSGGTSSVSATGKVTFTSVTTSLSVNGVFSATHDTYLIVMRNTNAIGNGAWTIKLRASGSDATNNYTTQYIFANSTSVTGARATSQAAGRAGTSRTESGGTHIYMYGPNLAQPTAWRTVDVSSGSGTPIIFDFASTHSLSSAYDGFSLFPDSSYASTGALTVYGLSQ